MSNRDKELTANFALAVAGITEQDDYDFDHIINGLVLATSAMLFDYILACGKEINEESVADVVSRFSDNLTTMSAQGIVAINEVGINSQD